MTPAQAMELARLIKSLPYLCTQQQMMVLVDGIIALAEENAKLKAGLLPASEMPEHMRLLAIAMLERDIAQAENVKLRAVLVWLDEGGGLGLDVHKRIRDALSPPSAAQHDEKEQA